ncbi:MAG: hypothetical protein ACK5T6_12090, partial [Pirellula sp.]
MPSYQQTDPRRQRELSELRNSELVQALTRRKGTWWATDFYVDVVHSWERVAEGGELVGSLADEYYND